MDPDSQSQEIVADDGQVPEDTSAPKKRKLYFEILLESCVVIVIIALVIGVFAYLKIIPLPFTSASFPINPSLNEVHSVTVNYSIVSTIKTITTKNSTLEFTLKTNLGSLPPFVVTNDTIFSGKGDLTSTSDQLKSRLKVGQGVAVTAVYEPKTKKWRTLRVFINRF